MKRPTIAFCILSLFVIMLPSCGSSTTQASAGGNSDASASDPDWQLVTSRGVQASIEFDGAAGTLSVTNNESSALTAPQLFIYNTTTAERSTVALTGLDSLAAAGTGEATFTYPGEAAPSDDAFFGLEFDEVSFGKFATAADFSELPPSITENDELSTSLNKMFPVSKAPGIPTSGTYTFSMTGGLGNLSGTNCPTSGTVGIGSSGTASLNVSCSGNMATLDIDGSVLQYQRMPSGTYITPEYQFPVRDEDDNIVIGENYYDFTPSSGSLLSGELHWDNTLGCTGDYPYTLTQITSSTPEILDVCEGQWAVSGLSAVTCGATVIASALTDYLPYPFADVSTIDDPSTGDPIFMNVSSPSTSWLMPRSSCSNLYGNFYAPMSFGNGIDTFGNPVVLSFSYQMTAVTENLMMGVGIVQGIGATTACSAPFFFTMTPTTSC